MPGYRVGPSAILRVFVYSGLIAVAIVLWWVLIKLSVDISAAF